MFKRCLKHKSERHLRKTSSHDISWMSYRGRLKDVLFNISQRYIKDIERCLTGDDLQMSYQNMSCKCLTEDDLQMSYLKMSCKCLIRGVFKTSQNSSED